MPHVAESDWKLFRKRLPAWQEAHMERLVAEYAAILTAPDAASEKFWALEARIKQDKQSPGVIVADCRRATMQQTIAALVLDGVITMADLDGFSEDVTDHINRLLEWRAL